ncbi:MAG: cellulase family glycosylhydrolase [Armatimonadetes bacterium]|nr:cellulase family glycosylhydrolase [Armatimonadota bacterium]
MMSLSTILPYFLLASGQQWFGPVEVQLPISTSGNPFDYENTDVRVRLTSSKANYERLAFTSHGAWKARLAVPVAGTYKAEILLNGKVVGKLPQPIEFTKKYSRGLVIRDKKVFYDGNSQEFWPVGHNLAWVDKDQKDYVTKFANMGKAGINWTRVWATHWNDRNPYWVMSFPQPKPDEMSEDALDRWDQVFREAEKNGIHVQLVLFHHGQFSSTVNPNWPDHPWNAKKGGWLQSASEFFTDPKAKKLTKQWLRYAAARWGCSPGLMSWELFNEVQFVDLASEPGGWATIGKWHDEMADFIRSVDSYHRLITTSSELDAPIWNKMDYIQGHGYPSSIEGLLMGTKPDANKPLFYGEIGLNRGVQGIEEERLIRDGIWAAFFAGHAGAGQYWYWDHLDRASAMAEYKKNINLIAELKSPSAFKSEPIKATVARGGILKFTPGRSWAKTDKTEFNLPAESGAEFSGQVSSFLQGPGKPEMQAGPFVFRFKASKPGKFTLRAAQVSRAGADIEIRVNGKVATSRTYPGGEGDQPAPGNIVANYPAGQVELKVINKGPDWLNVSGYEFEGLGAAASVVASRAKNMLVLRIKSGKVGERVELATILKTPGRRRVLVTDLETGKRTVEMISVPVGKLVWKTRSTDELLMFPLS